jgi:hypothetical protein
MKRWKTKVLLISLLCGALYCAYERYDFFRLRELAITPIGILPDSTIWRSVPALAVRFWPSFFFKGREFVSKIDGYYPVELKVRPSGWGKFSVSISPLEPMLYVSWNSNMWLLSTNGRMWPANLPSNTRVKGMILPEKPILAWDSGLPMPIDPQRQKGEIYPSSLPLAKIKKWYEAVEKIGWEDDIYCILAKRIDGRPVVQMLIGSSDNITSEVVVKEDTSDWASIAAALYEVFPESGSRIPNGMVVNATFSDMKFTVTSRDNR